MVFTDSCVAGLVCFHNKDGTNPSSPNEWSYDRVLFEAALSAGTDSRRGIVGVAAIGLSDVVALDDLPGAGQ